MRKLLLLLILLAALKVSFAQSDVYSSNYAEYHNIQEDETNVEIRQTIGIHERNYFFPVGNWVSTIYLSKNMENLLVKDAFIQIPYNITQEEYYTVIQIANTQEIYYGEADYLLNITYSPINKPIKYQNIREYNHPCLIGINNDKDTRYEFTIPAGANLLFTSINPKRIDSPPNKGQTLIYDLANNTTDCQDLVIRYQVDESSDIEVFTIGEFTVEVPLQYRTQVFKIMEKINEELPNIQVIFEAVTPPDSFYVRFVPLNETLADEGDPRGTYTGGGQINIASRILSDSEDEIMQVILHEVTHSFDSFSYSFWWNEGLAEAISYRIMDNRGIDTSDFIDLQERTINSWRNCGNSYSFITDWRINPNNTVEVVRPANELCKGYPKDQTAYSYSGYFIENLIEEYGIEVITDTYDLIINKYPNITSYRFKENITPKMGFILNEATGNQTVDIFEEYGFGGDEWNGELFLQRYEEFVEDLEYEEKTPAERIISDIKDKAQVSTFLDKIKIFILSIIDYFRQ